MRRKHLGLIAFMLIPVILSGCQLLPQEEVLPAAPVIHAYEAEEYEYATVARGDMASTTTLTAYYEIIKQQDLSFPLGGFYIASVSAEVGQQVKAGDILATLEQGDIQTQIDAKQHEINKRYKESEHLKETLELELTQSDATLASLEQELQQLQASVPAEEDAETIQQRIDALILQKESLEQRKISAQNTYDQQMQSIDDSLYVASLRLKELKSTLEHRQLVAEIDGVVTYVYYMPGEYHSIKDETYITVSDLNSAAFTVDEKHAAYFPVGTEVIITCNGQEYEAIVVEAADLGIDEPDTEEPAPVYCKLKESTLSFKEYEKGTISVTEEQRTNVLYVQQEAVHTANDESFVYLIDEDGLRTMQSVATGLQANGFIEIVTGLNEGDRVIIE